MEKKSGVSETTHSLPGGGGGIRSIGETFQPNLAMGGGSYRVPIELPTGPGGFAPSLDLVYHTGYGNGPFGLGWSLSVPFIECRRKSPLPAGELEYSVAGAETLVPLSDGSFAAFVQQTHQTFAFDGIEWTSTAPNLIELRFGSSDESRVSGDVNGVEQVQRWLLDRVTFPGERNIDFEYQIDGNQRYLQRIRWSVFRLEFEYESRPDPYSQHTAGFELRTTRRCTRIALHQDRLEPATLMRSYSLDYQAADKVGTSLLHRIRTSGWRFEDGTLRETALPPLTFDYTGFDPATQHIQKYESNTVPPPPFGEDVTLLDYRGTALPGVFRLDGLEATFWENRGQLTWGPPERLRALPQGLRLGDNGVRFADLTGDGTADLVVSTEEGGGYYPNDPELGFLPKRHTPLVPDFDLGEEGSWLLDLDGDGVADLLTFRNGVPMALFNERGESWSRPRVLSGDGLPNFSQHSARLRFADMNGDGTADMVLLQSRRVIYWPYLGNGAWGPKRAMAETPEFDVLRPDEDVYLTDVDGDGTADLVLVGSGVVHIYLNSGGEAFSQPIELRRTPQLGVEQFLLTDMTGSGTSGLLWTIEGGATTPHEYWFLDLLNGVKPYLLSSIDNGCGLTTTIEYTTSAMERTLDLEDGRRWWGYLPFVVHVVKRMTQSDAATGQEAQTEYRYHEGHYDRRAQEYLGFGCVDSIRLATANEAAAHQRFYFHNRGTTADDPAFVAGKGQPHRTELVDPSTGEIRQVEEATWEARLAPSASAERPAYLALETTRTSRRLQDSLVYEHEQVDFQHDEIGNLTREHRRGDWSDSSGIAHVDELIIETSYASHSTHGLTSFPSRIRKMDGNGRLLKQATIFYDGPAFTGLPLGAVERGWKTRQADVTLTDPQITDAYAGEVPLPLETMYRFEIDPDYGRLLVADTQRYRLDSFGNQLETLSALGRQVAIAYDPEGIHPVSISEDGGPPRELTFDPIAQQLTRNEDPNGNLTETRYDGTGNIVAVYGRGAQPDRPTETFEYVRDLVPNVVIKRIRINPADEEPGWVNYQYRDGAGRVCQAKTLTEDGRWAVSKQELVSLSSGRSLGEREAYFSTTPDFDFAPPSGLPERALFYDFGGRLVKERLFSGDITRHDYVGSEARFYGPDASVSFEADPAAPPTRISRTDAWGNMVSIEEVDEDGRYEQRRAYDALGRLTRITDSMGHVALDSVFDCWDNRIRVFSAEADTMVSVFDAGSNELVRTDADGRSVFFGRDRQGRITEVRTSAIEAPPEETYTYDNGSGDNLRGRLASVSGAFGAAEYSYSKDGDPILIRRTFPGNPTTYEVRFGYNNQRDVTFVEYPDGAHVDYLYHPNGLLASIPGFIETIEYDARGERERILYANGLETRLSYTPGDHLLFEILTQPAAGGPKYQHLVHHLDTAGQVVQIDDLSSVPGKVRNNQTFHYDRRNRLIKATGNDSGGGYEFDYRYDELSNLVFSGEAFADEIDYGHQVGDSLHPNRLIKLHAAPATQYAYDASGNLTGDPALGALTYDARRRLVKVEKPDGTTIEYRYDHNDRRVESRVTKGGDTTVRYEIEDVYLVQAGSGTRIVFDGERRLAIMPQSGDALLYHRDRLGNVNVVSNLSTGAFVGHDEYTPFGALSISMVVMPHFSFQGSRFEDDLDAALLGARYYRPSLGRFLTPDEFLAVNQERLTGILAAANLYLYALANPTNFTDPTGQIVFLAVVAIAAIVGAVLGAVGAALNGVRTWDEYLLWIIGGAVGGILATLVPALVVLGFVGSSAAFATAVVTGTVWAVGSVLGTFFAPRLDESDSPLAWVFSFMIKWCQSPLLTTLGSVFASGLALDDWKMDFRRGNLFINTGENSAKTLTLGGISWAGRNAFKNGRVTDALARHESFHSRQAACMGEAGFYITYLTLGNIWAAEQKGAWNSVNKKGPNVGCGNPFEKTAHTFTGDPTTPADPSQCGN